MNNQQKCQRCQTKVTAQSIYCHKCGFNLKINEIKDDLIKSKEEIIEQLPETKKSFNPSILKYPFTNIKSFLIVVGLSALSFLILPGILVVDYLLQIIRSSLERKQEMPFFNFQNIKCGLIGIFIALIYFFIPVIILYFGLKENLLILILCGIFLMFIAGLLLPIAWITFIQHKIVSNTFNLKKIISIFAKKRAEYLTHYLIIVFSLGIWSFIINILTPLFTNALIIGFILYLFLDCFIALWLTIILVRKYCVIYLGDKH